MTVCKGWEEVQSAAKDVCCSSVCLFYYKIVKYLYFQISYSTRVAYLEKMNKTSDFCV